MTYPKELYRNNHYRVVFSPEEHAQFRAEGWKDEMDRERANYVVFNSGVPEELPEPERRGPGRPKKLPDAEE